MSGSSLAKYVYWLMALYAMMRLHAADVFKFTFIVARGKALLVSDCTDVSTFWQVLSSRACFKSRELLFVNTGASFASRDILVSM